MPRIIALEGNIGAGKSTLMAALKARFSKDTRIAFADEPVNLWQSIRNEEGKSILECYYADPRKYAFCFQMIACGTRLKALRDASSPAFGSPPPDIVVTERCLDSDYKVFAKLLIADGLLSSTEVATYGIWRDAVGDLFAPSAILYLRSTPSLARARIHERARVGEVVDIEYLKRLHVAHEEWITSLAGCVTGGTVVLDAQQGPGVIARDAIRHIERMLN